MAVSNLQDAGSKKFLILFSFCCAHPATIQGVAANNDRFEKVGQFSGFSLVDRGLPG